jgi:precorrin-4/cobalt-precorrin-4 C11-methyltransferase
MEKHENIEIDAQKNTNRDPQVYFVGAGPGAADLITVRGMKLIGMADVIIYAGSLVNPELLGYAKQDAEIHNSAYMTLEDVIDVMKKSADAGLTVCRLHTGDPSLYGAVREQMDALDELGISYQSCPGVSAAFGAAAAMDLEFTLPGISQSLIITRMAGRTAVPPKESIESWAAHDSTMAVYLSTGMLAELSKRLIDGGYREDTPAVIASRATWPDEGYFRCTVSELAETAAEHGITKTALILVGDVLGGKAYEKSKLYDRDFATGFRPASTDCGSDDTDAGQR